MSTRTREHTRAHEHEPSNAVPGYETGEEGMEMRRRALHTLVDGLEALLLLLDPLCIHELELPAFVVLLGRRHLLTQTPRTCRRRRPATGDGEVGAAACRRRKQQRRDDKHTRSGVVLVPLRCVACGEVGYLRLSGLLESSCYWASPPGGIITTGPFHPAQQDREA
jgi:hypothetical protein